MNREQVLWAIALRVEKHHGAAAANYIGEQVKRLAEQGDEGGVALWFAIADRFDALQSRSTHA